VPSVYFIFGLACVLWPVSTGGAWFLEWFSTVNLSVQWRLDYAVCERLFDLIQQQIVFFTYSKGGKLEAMSEDL
jgi:hypothetical protein